MNNYQTIWIMVEILNVSDKLSKSKTLLRIKKINIGLISLV